MAHDLPYLSAMGVLQGHPLNLRTFVSDRYLRQVMGPAYATDLASAANPAAITGTDPACHLRVTSAASAGEVWLAGPGASGPGASGPGAGGRDTTQPAATPACLLLDIRADQQAGHDVLAAYIPDAVTGTRWFADKCLWAQIPGAPRDRRFLPFTTQAGADAYAAAHPGARILSYAAALAAS